MPGGELGGLRTGSTRSWSCAPGDSSRGSLERDWGRDGQWTGREAHRPQQTPRMVRPSPWGPLPPPIHFLLPKPVPPFTHVLLGIASPFKPKYRLERKATPPMKSLHVGLSSPDIEIPCRSQPVARAWYPLTLSSSSGVSSSSVLGSPCPPACLQDPAREPSFLQPRPQEALTNSCSGIQILHFEEVQAPSAGDWLSPCTSTHQLGVERGKPGFCRCPYPFSGAP